MSPKVPIKKLIRGNLIVIGIILVFMAIFSDVFHLFELKTLDTRYIIRDMLNNNPKIHEDIINVNIDDYSIQESESIGQWPKRYYANLIDKLSESNSKIIAERVLCTMTSVLILRPYVVIICNAIKPFILLNYVNNKI